jgi:hypothetical protein
MGDLFYPSEKEIDCILLTAVVADLITSPVNQHSIFSPITIGFSLGAAWQSRERRVIAPSNSDGIAVISSNSCIT